MAFTLPVEIGSATKFEHNLAVLRRHQPDIVDDLLKRFASSNDLADQIAVVESKTGDPVLKYKDVLLHSLYAPVKEAQKFVSGLELNPNINVVLMGVGMGYHLEQIIERSRKRDMILVIEKSIGIFKHFLANRNIDNLYGKCKIYFCVGKNPMDIFRALQGCALTIFANGITAVKHPASIKIDPVYYEQVEVKIRDIFQWARVNTLSQINASNDYADNIFSNMPVYLKMPGIKRLFGKFEGFPGIIVSAGPSLIKNIRYLKEAQGRAIIISVDTALRVLLNHGIEPDIVVSIDYTAHNARYFDGISNNNYALVIDPEVYPSIIKRHDGPKFMISLPGKSLCDWLSDNVENKGEMDKGLSVAHTAFLLALRLGLTPVGFVGQDLSFPGNMTHVRGSAMVRKNHIDENHKETVKVKDIFGGIVSTSTSMQVFLNHFEDLLDKHKMECYDLTEGGARIVGANPMPLKEYIVTKLKKRVDTKEIIREACDIPVKYDRKKLFRVIDKSVDGLNRVSSSCKNTEKVLNKIDKRINQNAMNYNLRSLFKQWAGASKEIRGNRDVFKILGNNITDVMLLQTKKETHDLTALDEDNKDGIMELLNKDRIVFSRLVEQCDKFCKDFVNFKRTVQEDAC